jgi:PadR family transcriptional regulator PadR
MKQDKPGTKQELLPGTLELLVLKVLVGEAKHGYAIVREIQRRSAEVLNVEEGSLYPALYRMERQGWIEAEWGQSESNRRAKFYALTRSGRRELAAQTAQWRRMSVAIEGVLAPEGA